MKKPAALEKPPSKWMMLGTGVLGFAVFAALLGAFYYNRVPDWSPADIEAPGLRDENPRPWVEEAGFNLPPVGSLPSLQSAMRDNAALRDKVIAFSQKTEGDLFANYRQADADVTTILLLWAGANLSARGKTRDGYDPRVDAFLRRVFDMGGLEPMRHNPRLGRDPWPRLFAYYKMRLIAQTPGGGAPFARGVSYDLRTDRISARGGLDRRFFADFAAFSRAEDNAGALRRNLLQYIEAAAPELADQAASALSQ